jgi:hypothetical protein
MIEQARSGLIMVSRTVAFAALDDISLKAEISGGSRIRDVHLAASFT